MFYGETMGMLHKNILIDFQLALNVSATIEKMNRGEELAYFELEYLNQLSEVVQSKKMAMFKRIDYMHK